MTDAGSRNNSSSSKVLNRSSLTLHDYRLLMSGLLCQSFLYSFEIHLVTGIVGYVTAYFSASSLMSVLPTIFQIVSATLVLFFAKISDVVGRAEALTTVMAVYILGYIIQGLAATFGQFVTGSVFSSIGTTGMTALTHILIADTTPLIDRGIMFGLWDIGAVFNIFVAQMLLDPLTLYWGWRWVYVIACIVTTIGAIAVLTPLWHIQRKQTTDQTDDDTTSVVKQQQQQQQQQHHHQQQQQADKTEPRHPSPRRRRRRRSLAWFFREFDTFGVLTLMLGLLLTLFPLTLAHTFPDNYTNPFILLSFCTGVLILLGFGLYEARWAERPIIPRRLLWRPDNRSTCLAALLVQAILTFMANLNWEYFTLYLVISRDLTFGQALFLERGYQLAYLILSPLTGLAMKRTGHCRLFVWCGIVLVLTGTVLMIPARTPSSPRALVVLSQTVAGVGAGMAHLAASVAVTAVVAPQDVATAIGANQVLSAIAGAFGSAIAGAVWTQVLPRRLLARVGRPEQGDYDWHRVMNDPFYIQALPQPTKGRVIAAYSDSQMVLTVLSASLSVFAVLCAVCMQHVDLKRDQVHPDNHGATTRSDGSEEVFSHCGHSTDEDQTRLLSTSNKPQQASSSYGSIPK
ncbi:hypothetical protein BGW42_001834 [Actinomortierella wolfii]|nr:hypothetical protein BGW42_001834 [Actinomortierella wolfii]